MHILKNLGGKWKITLRDKNDLQQSLLLPRASFEDWKTSERAR